MANQCVVVFCRNQAEINAAVQRYKNEEGFKRVHTSKVDQTAEHHLKVEAGYTRSACTPIGDYKAIVVFGR